MMKLTLEQLRLFFDGISLGVCCVDQELKIRLTNPAMTNVFGFSPEEFLRLSLRDITHPGDLSDTKAKYGETEKGDGYTVIRRYLHKDGSYSPVKLTVTRLPPNDLGFDGMAVIEDLSSQMEVEAFIDEQQIRLAQSAKMAALGEMAAGIAHEVNNPLAIIAMNLEQIREMIESKSPDQATILQNISTAVRTVGRIAKIIGGLRSFARDGQKGDTQAVKPEQIVHDTLSLCQQKFSHHGVQLRVLDGGAGIIPIACRPVEISHALLNLLNNAFDAVEKLPEKWIEIAFKEKDAYVEISVTDSGAGIPPEVQGKVMQPFFTTKEVGKGTGLGLSISRGIMEKHQGKLLLDPHCANTRFRMLVPKAQPAKKSA